MTVQNRDNLDRIDESLAVKDYMTASIPISDSQFEYHCNPFL